MTDLVSQLVGALELCQRALQSQWSPYLRAGDKEAAAMKAAATALTAAKAGGWVAVPVEPTPEMIREVEHTARFGAVWTAASVYKAMLAARPTTPPKDQA